MPVLDTDVLTFIQRGSGIEYDRLVARLNALPSGSLAATTIISFEEQMRGWMALISRARSSAQLTTAYQKLRDFLIDFSRRNVMPFDSRCGSVYDGLRQSGLRIGALDLRIAAVALANDEILISRNLRDFRKVPGLRVEDWTQ